MRHVVEDYETEEVVGIVEIWNQLHHLHGY
jgi:hypothetical protein